MSRKQMLGFMWLGCLICLPLSGFCQDKEVAIQAAYVFSGQASAVNMVNGDGMDDNDQNTTPALWPTNHPQDWVSWQNLVADEWMSASRDNYLTNGFNGKIGWAILDLGSVKYELSKMYIWNCRSDVLKRAVTNNIYYSSNPSVPPSNTTGVVDYDFSSGGWSLLNTNGPLTFSTVRANVPAYVENIVSLNGISARYIGIEVLTNNGDANEVGLAEVGITLTPTVAGNYVIIN